MMNANSRTGMILRCDGSGAVVEIIHESVDLVGLARLGRSISSLVEPRSFSKALDFLADLRLRGNAYNWEINLALDQRIEAFRFSGATDGDCLIIAVVPSDEGVDSLIEEMARINSSHVTVLRRLFKEQAGSSHGGDDIYTSMSRLNNELLNTQRDLAKANATLKAANEDKSRLIGILAHALRSPLGVVSGFAEVLQMVLGERLSEKEMSYLDSIHTATGYMLALVDDTLSLSSIESGQLKLERSPVDLSGMVAKIVGLLGLSAGRKGITLDFDTPPIPLEIAIDPVRIEQLLHNLIGNAIKFCRAGDTIRVSLAKTEGEVRMTITDSGTGMSAKTMQSLFEPFSRAGNTGTAGENSTGLGLHICQRIVEAHDGTITAGSELSQGTTFTVALPLRA
jgi:two-component system OmpR family sensor kinase